MKPKQRQRAKRGSVQINERGDRLQLRWTIGGQRFSLSLGLNTALNWHNARKLASQIEQDIILNLFDSTLARYKPEPIAETTDLSITTVELFKQFINFRRSEGTSEQAISARYNSLAANLERFGRSIESESDARRLIDLLRSRQSTRIANQNLSLLKGFAEWASAKHLIPENWFRNIKPLKESKSVSPTRRPFSRDEVARLLTTAKTHPKLYKWHDFCMVLMYLGLRPSEAIGLRWQDFDLERGEVTISSALARGGDGKSAGYARVRKGTKTGTVRVLTMPKTLLAMLKGRAACTQTSPETLVFTSPKGKPIDDHNFSQRVWAQLCTDAGVPYRVPYACRHTLLSHGIENGMTPQQAAYVAGHVDARMVTRTYGHMINRPNLIDWQE